MKRKVLAIGTSTLMLLLIFTVSTMNRASPQSQAGELHPIWVKIWGGAGDDEALSIAVKSPYIYITGETNSYGAGFCDAFLLKYDEENLLWNVTWGGVDEDWGAAIIVAAPHIYIAGLTESYGPHKGYDDILLLSYDDEGNLLWNSTWCGGSLNAVAESSSYIYTAGWTNIYGAGNFDVFLLKYDINGNLQWYRTWGGVKNDSAMCLAVTPSYIYLAGYTQSYGKNPIDVFVLKYDKNGNLIWNKTWGGGGCAHELAVSGSDIYVVGTTGEDNADVFLLKYNEDGELLWDKIWRGPRTDHARSIAVSSSYIYISGYTNSFSESLLDWEALLMKYDENGNLLWIKTWGGKGCHSANGLAITKSYIYLTGYTADSPALNKKDVFLLKADLPSEIKEKEGEGARQPDVLSYVLIVVIIVLVIIIIWIPRRKKKQPERTQSQHLPQQQPPLTQYPSQQSSQPKLAKK